MIKFNVGDFVAIFVAKPKACRAGCRCFFRDGPHVTCRLDVVASAIGLPRYYA